MEPEGSLCLNKRDVTGQVWILVTTFSFNTYGGRSSLHDAIAQEEWC